MVLMLVYYSFIYSSTFSNIIGLIPVALRLTIVGRLFLIGAQDFAVFLALKKYKRRKKGKKIKKRKKKKDSLYLVLWALERSLPYAPMLLSLLLMFVVFLYSSVCRLFVFGGHFCSSLLVYTFSFYSLYIPLHFLSDWQLKNANPVLLFVSALFVYTLLLLIFFVHTVQSYLPVVSLLPLPQSQQTPDRGITFRVPRLDIFALETST